jgi:GNAT superfamily N-acetyltransferase
MEDIKIVTTNAENIEDYGICGYKNPKNEGYRLKLDWIKERFKEGLRYKVLYSEQDGAVGGIEYIPGEYAWRPVEARGYMFIHCIFIVSRKYKGKGYGALLVKTCLEDAQNEGMVGVAVVTRKGSWMAGEEIFIKQNFKVVDTAPPDFKLLVRKFKDKTPLPKFKGDWEERLAPYKEGLTIFQSFQCPFPGNSIPEINELAEREYGITPNIVKLNSGREAQNSPCVFGTFCIIYNGKVVADRPISKTRFGNIMKKCK